MNIIAKAETEGPTLSRPPIIFIVYYYLSHESLGKIALRVHVKDIRAFPAQLVIFHTIPEGQECLGCLGEHAYALLDRGVSWSFRREVLH